MRSERPSSGTRNSAGAIARRITAAGTIVAAFAGFWAAPLAGTQLSLLALSTALAVGVGAEAHARLHPRFRLRDGHQVTGFGLGPAMTAAAAALTAGRLEPPLTQAVPFVGALFVGMLLLAQERELSEQHEERWTPLAAALILYLAAFVLFVTIYAGRESTLQAVIGTGLSAVLIGVALLRPTGARMRRVWLFAGLIGLGVAELAFVLGTWITAGLLGGAFLLLYFYVAGGLIQSLLEGTLSTRLVVEYSLVGLVGLVLILSTSPWRP
jgi:hypothetical protein